MGKSFAFLVLVAATVAVGYTAWETRNLRISLDRLAVGNETSITEVMISLAHAEGQLARIQEAVELLGGGGSATNASALEGKITTTLTAAQREVLQQELNKWAKPARGPAREGLGRVAPGAGRQKLSRSDVNAAERDKRSAELKALVEANQKNLTAQLQKLGDGLSGSPAAVKEQGEALTSLEKRLAAVLKATENNQEGSVSAQPARRKALEGRVPGVAGEQGGDAATLRRARRTFGPATERRRDERRPGTCRAAATGAQPATGNPDRTGEAGRVLPRGAAVRALREPLVSCVVNSRDKSRRIFRRRQGATTCRGDRRSPNDGGYHARKSNAADGEKDPQIMLRINQTPH